MGDPILFTFTFTFNCHGIAISALHLGLNLGKTHISYCPGACQPKGGDTRLQVLGGRPCEQSRLGVRFDVARSGPGGLGLGGVGSGSSPPGVCFRSTKVRATRPQRQRQSGLWWYNGWSVPCVSIQLTLLSQDALLKSEVAQNRSAEGARGATPQLSTHGRTQEK